MNLKDGIEVVQFGIEKIWKMVLENVWVSKMRARVEYPT